MRVDFGKETCHVLLFMEHGHCFISSEYFESDEKVLEEILELVKEYSFDGVLPKLTVYDVSYCNTEVYHVICGEVDATITYTDHMIIR